MNTHKIMDNNKTYNNTVLHKECQRDGSLSERRGRTKHKRYGENSSESASNEGSSSSE